MCRELWFQWYTKWHNLLVLLSADHCHMESKFLEGVQVNRRKDRWLCANHTEILTMMHSKLTSSVIVPGVVNTEDHVLPSHVIHVSTGCYSQCHIERLDIVIIARVEEVAVRFLTRLFSFTRNPVASRESIWSPNCSDLHPINFGAASG